MLQFKSLGIGTFLVYRRIIMEDNYITLEDFTKEAKTNFFKEHKEIFKCKCGKIIGKYVFVKNSPLVGVLIGDVVVYKDVIFRCMECGRAYSLYSFNVSDNAKIMKKNSIL
jgi:hypothetical protein